MSRRHELEEQLVLLSVRGVPGAEAAEHTGQAERGEDPFLWRKLRLDRGSGRQLRRRQRLLVLAVVRREGINGLVPSQERSCSLSI